MRFPLQRLANHLGPVFQAWLIVEAMRFLLMVWPIATWRAGLSPGGSLGCGSCSQPLLRAAQTALPSVFALAGGPAMRMCPVATGGCWPSGAPLARPLGSCYAPRSVAQPDVLAQPLGRLPGISPWLFAGPALGAVVVPWRLATLLANRSEPWLLTHRSCLEERPSEPTAQPRFPLLDRRSGLIPAAKRRRRCRRRAGGVRQAAGGVPGQRQAEFLLAWPCCWCFGLPDRGIGPNRAARSWLLAVGGAPTLSISA